MGSSNSGRRRGMSETPDSRSAETGESEPDLPSILASLIRSGQVRIYTSNQTDLSDDDDDDDSYIDDDNDDDDDDYMEFYSSSQVDPTPDTSFISKNDLRQEILQMSGRCHRWKSYCPPSVCHMVQKREIGMNGKQHFSQGDHCVMGAVYLPNSMQRVATYRNKAFCGTFSNEGNIFLSASQDQYIRVYNTTKGCFNLIKTIRARDVGWSILDVAFSPDCNYIVYSSWSDSIHLCNIQGDSETHEALPLFPNESNFCIFSLTFSSDNREILGGANWGCFYIYDRESNQRILKIDAHDDDVNAVAFADTGSQILFSGADDGLCKVWDRRTLREEDPQPVGTFSGHSDGITYIDSKGDARYLLSNSKDQTIKLWDVRWFSSKEGAEATKKAVSVQRWDYRWQQVPRRMNRVQKLVGDTSIMSYRGHSVLHTLIRCHFSPEFTTGQRYIYTGCASGCVVVYDLLTGEIVTKLDGHKACVRDVSWHPFENKIMSTSWDATIGMWSYQCKADLYDSDNDKDVASGNSDSEPAAGKLRRSKRLKEKERRRQREDCLRSTRKLFD